MDRPSSRNRESLTAPAHHHFNKAGHFPLCLATCFVPEVDAALVANSRPSLRKGRRPSRLPSCRPEPLRCPDLRREALSRRDEIISGSGASEVRCSCSCLGACGEPRMKTSNGCELLERKAFCGGLPRHSLLKRHHPRMSSACRSQP